jgi:hypothetical protein
MKTTFETIIKGFGNNTGIEVPPDSLEALGSSKRPPVSVTVAGYTYKSTVASMSGKYMISLSKAHREASGLKAGDAVTVTLELDAGVREVEVPIPLRKALVDAKLDVVFSKLAYSKRKEFARQIVDAKTEETRQKRVKKVIETISQL